MSQIDWSKAPEGATHYMPNQIDCFACWVKVLEGEAFFNYGRTGSAWRPWVGWEKFRAVAIPRPTPAWNGEGLPPVGVDIEFKSSAGEWLTGQYIGQFNGKIIAGCHATGVVGYLQSGEMRPIRTPEQIAADERESAVNGMLCYDALGGSRRGLAEALYDAGYRKQEQPK